MVKLANKNVTLSRPSGISQCTHGFDALGFILKGHGLVLGFRLYEQPVEALQKPIIY